MSRHTDQTSGRRVVLVPSRDDLVDAALTSTLMLLALIGFRTTFSGSGYLIAGMSGLVLGLLIAHLANALRQPMIAVAAMTLAVFFLLGGAIALQDTAVAGVLPSGRTFSGLADQSVHGWKDLLTTLPPVDGSGPLLVLPYILGLLGGVGAFCLARRTRFSLAPVAPPLAALVLVILLGTQTSAAQVLQGSVFGVVALGWAALRAQRLRPVISSGSGRAARAVTIAALLAVAAGGATLLGPHVPGRDSNDRVVLRKYVDPPFDVGEYPSPLAGFRKFTKGYLNGTNASLKTLYKEPLFTVRGLPAGTPVRIATLDEYDGVTWRASSDAGSGTVPDTFQRVGQELVNPARGRSVSYEVTIDAGYDTRLFQSGRTDVWLPDAGALSSLEFHGSSAQRHADYFRYNLATGTGIVPDRLVAGDRYTARAVLPTDGGVLTRNDSVSSGASDTDAGSFLKSQADDWSSKASTPAEKVLAIATRLRTSGRYTDGDKPNQSVLPGHYRKRLVTFVDDVQTVGNDEQYAATFALLVTQLGVPARVVFGATPAADGVVKGSDVHAWVEVELADGTWATIPTDEFMSRIKPDKQQPQPQPKKQVGQIVPPPSRGKPRSSLDDASAANARSRTQTTKPTDAAAASGLPGWVITTAKVVGTPVLVVLVFCALVVGLKFERRRRRRTRGSPANRFSQGWREVLDHARDLGATAVGGATRKEQAALLSVHDVTDLARSADAFVFGPADPVDKDAARFWQDVDRTRRRMSAAVGRRRRILATLSLASFLRPRRVTQSESA